MKYNYYVGPELLFTPANGLQTVYTCQQKSAAQILAVVKEHNASHVRLGYLGTFQRNKLYNWVIQELLDNNLKVTLEYSSDLHHIAQELIIPEIWNHYNFIPLSMINSANSQNHRNQSFCFADEPGTWSYTSKSVLDSNNFTAKEDVSQIAGLSVNDTLYKPRATNDDND